MRKPRVLGNRKSNFYHVMSRVVDRQYIFGDEEKEFFRLTMHKLEAFTGIRILTYCIMSNHWHILIEVPSCEDLSREEIFRRIERFYSKQRAREIRQEFDQAHQYAQQSGITDWETAVLEKYQSRMGDLSVFVKELKERFSKWYNRKHGRRGTLWEERFKSVLVENSTHALTTMAAYIDLNAVRAGIVEDPKEYRYCGYAEAVAGNTDARRGICQVQQADENQQSWRSIIAQYRTHLFCTGLQTEVRKGISAEHVQKVLEKEGELTLGELLHCRVRYFSDGVALGSKLFLEEIFENNRELFGKRRKEGARAMRGGDWNGLCSLRDLSHAIAAPG
jgi:REP element-mobilizing transposase RayT